MPKFEGCAEAREISLTRKAAQPRAVVLLTKNAAGHPAAGTQPENDSMTQAEITKAALSMIAAVAKMDDVTKSYFLTLAEDAQVTFLAKSASDMAEEAAEDKKTKDAKAKEDEAAKSGVSVEVVELRKSNETLTARLAELEKKDAEREIEKRADAEFAGFPGGAAAVVPLLKAYATLPEAARKASEAVLKGQCAAAASLTRTLSVRTDADISKAEGAKTRLVEAAKTLAADRKISLGQAIEKISEKREFAADVAEIEAAGLDLFA